MLMLVFQHRNVVGDDAYRYLLRAQRYGQVSDMLPCTSGTRPNFFLATPTSLPESARSPSHPDGEIGTVQVVLEFQAEVSVSAGGRCVNSHDQRCTQEEPKN